MRWIEAFNPYVALIESAQADVGMVSRLKESLLEGGYRTEIKSYHVLRDEKKGERLMVVYTKGAADADALYRLLAESALPNLWKPGRDCYLEVDSLPMLGTGKLDLRGLKEIALAAR